LKTAVDTVANRTVTYVNNASGQLLQRTSSTASTTYKTNWYYAQNQHVGDISTDPAAASYRVSYAESLAHSAAATANPDAFRNLSPVSSADFDQNYEPVSPTYPTGVPSAVHFWFHRPFPPIFCEIHAVTCLQTCNFLSSQVPSSPLFKPISTSGCATARPQRTVAS
jgi:hypothetical protein